MRRTGIGFAVAGLAAVSLLAGCHRPAMKSAQSQGQDAAAPAAAVVPAGPDRDGPARWNAATGGFELNGKPVTTTKLWTFDGSTDGFTTMGSKIAPAAGQGAEVTVGDPILRSPKGLNVPGARYDLVLIRLTRVAPGPLWDGALYYSTAAHGEASAYFGKPLAGADPKVGETVTLVYDMSHQSRGAPDWSQSMIDQIRLDIDDKPGGKVIIRQVAIGIDPDPAAMAAMAPPPKAKAGADAPAKP